MIPERDHGDAPALSDHTRSLWERYRDPQWNARGAYGRWHYHTASIDLDPLVPFVPTCREEALVAGDGAFRVGDLVTWKHHPHQPHLRSIGVVVGRNMSKYPDIDVSVRTIEGLQQSGGYSSGSLVWIGWTPDPDGEFE